MFQPRIAATNLAQLRRMRGNTLDELAATVGSDPSTLSRAERAILRPPRRVLSALAGIFDVPEAELLTPPTEAVAADPAAALEAV